MHGARALLVIISVGFGQRENGRARIFDIQIEHALSRIDQVAADGRPSGRRCPRQRPVDFRLHHVRPFGRVSFKFVRNRTAIHESRYFVSMTDGLDGAICIRRSSAELLEIYGNYFFAGEHTARQSVHVKRS